MSQYNCTTNEDSKIVYFSVSFCYPVVVWLEVSFYSKLKLRMPRMPAGNAVEIQIRTVYHIAIHVREAKQFFLNDFSNYSVYIK